MAPPPESRKLLSPGDGSNAIRQWSDEVGNKLEQRIGEIAIEILVVMEKRYRDSKIQHHEGLIERRKAAEAERIEALAEVMSCLDGAR